jgi:hypothetical protein
MNLRVVLLQPDDEEGYEAALKTNDTSLLYSSVKYRNLLRGVVDGEDYYLVAKQGGQVAGVLPAFLKRHARYGNVFNSLPFYGSNGGVTCGTVASDPLVVKRQLLGAFRDLALEKGAVSSTVIASPHEQDCHVYDEFAGSGYRDARIGQITHLPKLNEPSGASLMAIFHSKTRNLIRKAYKEGVQHRDSDGLDDLRFLADTHRQNIASMGGLPKEWAFFAQIPRFFSYGRDYRVYVAEWNGMRIAALLVFYYNRTVEYFTPAAVSEYRSLQSSSLLIFEAMKDAASSGYHYWNWGGTWHGQLGVYHFKKRWGTIDLPYQYYVRTASDISHIASLSPSEIVAAYRYFYVLPFSELGSTEPGTGCTDTEQNGRSNVALDGAQAANEHT